MPPVPGEHTAASVRCSGSASMSRLLLPSPSAVIGCHSQNCLELPAEKWIVSVQSHQYHDMRSHQTPSSSGQEPGLGLVYFPVSHRVPSAEGKREERWGHWNNGSSTWKDQHGLDQSERFCRKQNMTSVTCVIEYRVEQNPKNMHNVAFYLVSHMCTHVYLFTYVCDAYVHLYLCCMQTNTHPGSEGVLASILHVSV